MRGHGGGFRAWEPRLAHAVALKIVPSGPMTPVRRERNRWLSEARCVSRVCHPNMQHVQIHDAGEAGGWLYLVLEFVPGGSLKERFRGPLPPRAAAELMWPVAAALSAVHNAGLLHLDLKPARHSFSNRAGVDHVAGAASPGSVISASPRSLAVLDLSSMSLAGPWGTPCYMAPEQAIGSRRCRCGRRHLRPGRHSLRVAGRAARRCRALRRWKRRSSSGQIAFLPGG